MHDYSCMGNKGDGIYLTLAEIKLIQKPLKFGLWINRSHIFENLFMNEI